MQVHPLVADILAHWPAWHDQAACRGMDPDLFVPSISSRTWTNPLALRRIRKAKSVCSGCPVRRECLTDELAYEASYGPQPSIRGGSLSSERAAVYGDPETRVRLLLEQMDSQGFGKTLVDAGPATDALDPSLT